MNANHYVFENKVIKQVKLDRLIQLTVMKNLISGKIFVEFSTKDGKLKLQRNFDNTILGIEEARKFEKKIRSIADLYKYFGIVKEKDTYVISNTRKRNSKSKSAGGSEPGVTHEPRHVARRTRKKRSGD